MLYTLPWSRFELTVSVVIGTDCIGSCKSNHHATFILRLKVKRHIISIILFSLCDKQEVKLKGNFAIFYMLAKYVPGDIKYIYIHKV